MNKLVITALFTLPFLLASGEANIDPAAGIAPLTGADFYDRGRPNTDQVELGRLLFFDKILSGNRNISCATCHHPTLGTSDGLALPLGEGATGLGPDRRVPADAPVAGRVPRNSPALYFLGATEQARLFHDGRVAKDPNENWASGFWSPAREQLPAGLDNVLAVQAMFPVQSAVEMAGQKGENDIATAAALNRLAGRDGVWELLAERLRQIPEYVARFRGVYAHIDTAEDISFVDAANAIAAFEVDAFRGYDSPFDDYLRSRDHRALTLDARRGMNLFYGRANCASCHSGQFQTDNEFHAIAMPQIGPGKNDGWDQSYWQATGFMARLEDHGRARETLRPEDRYAFRTPSLRNVELTAPYGHSGAYTTLEAVIRHHADPVASFNNWRPAAAQLVAVDHVVETTATGSQLRYKPVNPGRLGDYRKRDTWVMQTAALREQILNANELEPVELSDGDINDLTAFLRALTDPVHRDAAHLVPERVPSGLPVDD
ncbi:MAG: cytochrome-c peroxidase [Chromatiales bacterium]|nr:MAG: cytochrome-c peroxidase [Chromatiales bacterium]